MITVIAVWISVVIICLSSQITETHGTLYHAPGTAMDYLIIIIQCTMYKVQGTAIQYIILPLKEVIQLILIIICPSLAS